MTKLLNRPRLLLALGIVALTAPVALACESPATPALVSTPSEWLDPNFWDHADVADVKTMLDRGADIHATVKGDIRGGFTPLHLAVQNGEPSVIGLLLDRGADIEAKDDRG